MLPLWSTIFPSFVYSGVSLVIKLIYTNCWKHGKLGKHKVEHGSGLNPALGEPHRCPFGMPTTFEFPSAVGALYLSQHLPVLVTFDLVAQPYEGPSAVPVFSFS